MFPNMNFMSDKWDEVVEPRPNFKSLFKTSTNASGNTLLWWWKMTCFTLEARVLKGVSKAVLGWFKFISIEKQSMSSLCFLFETTVFQYPCTEFVARPLSSAITSFLPLGIMVLFTSTFTSSLLFILTLPMHDHAHESWLCSSDAFIATSSPSWFQLHSDINKNLVSMSNWCSPKVLRWCLIVWSAPSERSGVMAKVKLPRQTASVVKRDFGCHHLCWVSYEVSMHSLVRFAIGRGLWRRYCWNLCWNGFYICWVWRKVLTWLDKF